MKRAPGSSLTITLADGAPVTVSVEASGAVLFATPTLAISLRPDEFALLVETLDRIDARQFAQLSIWLGAAQLGQPGRKGKGPRRP